MEREKSEMEANMKEKKRNSHADNTPRPFKLDMYLFVKFLTFFDH